MENNLVEERFLNSIHIKNEMMRDRETLVTIVELADEHVVMVDQLRIRCIS